MSTTVFQGLDIMVEVAMSYVESCTSDLSDEVRCILTQSFSDFLHGRINYDDCRNSLMKYVGRDEALVRINEIMTLPDEPLPMYEDPDSGDGQISLRKKTRTWTAIEDQRLLAGVARFGVENWQNVAHFLGSGRNRAQCSQRWTRGLNPKISKKSWTKEDDRQLQELVSIHGDKSWTKIAAILGNRSDVQCRYHYKQLQNSGEEENLPLRKSAITMSSDRLINTRQEPPNSRLTDEQRRPMSLFAGRNFYSSPGLTMPKISTANLTLPLAPLTFRNRNQNENIQSQTPPPPVPQMSMWGICGTDPQSLDSFLSNFE